MEKHQKELMTVEDFLEIYGISRSVYFAQVKKKLLKITRMGRRTLIKRTDADEWMRNLPQED